MNWLFGFSGRIGRLDWWLAQLVILATLAALVGILITLGLGAELADTPPDGDARFGLSMVLVILAAGGLTAWINLASTVKRFHDRNKSGYWALVIFIPYIGVIWQIVECGCLSGTPGGNNYGSGGSGGGSRNLDHFADEIASQYTRAPKAMAEAPSAAARVQSEVPVPTRRRVAQSGFGRRGV